MSTETLAAPAVMTDEERAKVREFDSAIGKHVEVYEKVRALYHRDLPEKAHERYRREPTQANMLSVVEATLSDKDRELAMEAATEAHRSVTWPLRSGIHSLVRSLLERKLERMEELAAKEKETLVSILGAGVVESDQRATPAELKAIGMRERLEAQTIAFINSNVPCGGLEEYLDRVLS